MRFATGELVLGMSRERSLKTLKKAEADPMAGLLASVSELSPDERAMVQILIRPALAPSMETIAFQAIIRLVAGANSARRARNRLAHMIAAFGQFGDESHPSAAISTSRWTIRLVCQGFPLSTVKPSLQTRDAISGSTQRFWHGHDLRRNGVPAWEAESSGPGDATRDPRQLSLAVSCPRVLDGRRGIAFPKWIWLGFCCMPC